jgi:amino acid transporter
MNTNDPTANASTPDPQDLTPEQAQQLLDQAEDTARRTPSAIPGVLITFAGLCTAGSFGTIGLNLAARIPETANFEPVVLVIVMVLAWIGVSLIPIFVFKDTWRRGLGKRWGIYITSWAVLWGLASGFATSAFGFWIAALFLVLFVIAVTQEAARAQQDRAEAGVR